MSRAKPFEIFKLDVYEAWLQVRANRGAHGIDEQTIKGFEENLKSNLYKLWNRLSSGSYFPPAVRSVEIPKPDGRMRQLGIPTVSDRVAQTVVRSHFEKQVEPYFHPDSYAYRQGRSTLDAIRVTRQLRKIKEQAKREEIYDTVATLTSFPKCKGVKKLQNRDDYRLRIGNWRVIFTASLEILYIGEVKKRNESTY